MICCDNLKHPFQNDPGTSQGQRVVDDLLSGTTKIDGRTMVDLLQFFKKLSTQVNYYNTKLEVKNWKTFFDNSLPFLIAEIIKSDELKIQKKFDKYCQLFQQNPSKQSLQLLIRFMFEQVIRRINTWHVSLNNSGLPIEMIVDKIIRDKLKLPVKKFITLSNYAAKFHDVKKIDFSMLINNKAWNISESEARSPGNYADNASTKRKRLIALQKEIVSLFPGLASAISVSSNAASASMEQSFVPGREQLAKQHQPHLALLFSFLKLFSHLQTDLNGFSRKHLDFFYKDVLKLRPADATADHAYIIFSIQKQLTEYRLPAGLQVKDGKDLNGQDIHFGLQKELIANQAQVKEIKTLHLKNQVIPNPGPTGGNLVVTEGVYIAPDAKMADGIDKDFQTEVRNFYTLGNKESKYLIPGTRLFKKYPNARLGFLLASPILFLEGGRRTVNVTIACELKDPVDQQDADSVCKSGKGSGKYPSNYPARKIFSKVQSAFRKYYVYVSEELIVAAATKGVSEATQMLLRERFLKKESRRVCGKEQPEYLWDNAVNWASWWADYYVNVEAGEKATIDELFNKRRMLKISFSGVKGWLEPDQIKRLRFTDLTIDPVTNRKTFSIKFSAVLKEQKPAIGFFDKIVLKEDYGTTMPVMKVELDDRIKVHRGFEPPEKDCCLGRVFDNAKIPLSFYYFLRNLKVLDTSDEQLAGGGFPYIEPHKTEIRVTVCGLKKFVVQNDDGLQDVNAPVYPFSARPKMGSSFFIGSPEIFSKKWSQIYINHNWVNLPLNETGALDFNNYYNGYQVQVWDRTVNPAVYKFTDVVEQDNFRVRFALLQDGTWHEQDDNVSPGDCGTNYLLFRNYTINSCDKTGVNRGFGFQHVLERAIDFTPLTTFPKEKISFDIKRKDNDTRNGFLKMTLRCQDFQHDAYPFVLARQMAALGKLPDDLVEGAVYYGMRLKPDGKPEITNIDIPAIFREIIDNKTISSTPIDLLSNGGNAIQQVILEAKKTNPVFGTIWNQLFVSKDPTDITGTTPAPAVPVPDNGSTSLTPANSDYFHNLSKIITWLRSLGTVLEKREGTGVVMPREPWTPIMQDLSIDYKASAFIDEIELIHLYPFDGTYKKETIALRPTLFPAHCDEGTLYLGLENLIPGSNLNILFQLAEATADSESETEPVFWHYLDNNLWKPLRNGFEVLHDGTHHLTGSGIVEFAMPENHSEKNTIMPGGIRWIKASIPKSSQSVCETTGIHTQSIEVVADNAALSDKSRLSAPLKAESISKLKDADVMVKKVEQPYDSFGGREPEAEKNYYVRVSELLRHKGRAVQKWDYEHLVLESFPMIYKAKCINHSYALNATLYKNDFPVAPGYVLLSVIPDLNKLKAGDAYQPRVPSALLEQVADKLRKLTSPFVRLRVMNPRYEKVNLGITVKLIKGMDENYYREKLAEDIRNFLAPWAVGEYDKLRFGECLNRSDLLRFMEALPYLDYILELSFQHENDVTASNTKQKVCPGTPRSILFAGNVDICIKQDDCEQWSICFDNRQQRVDCCANERITIL